jgi:hypothetical protein
VKPILETARLRRREMQPGDLDFVAAMLANEDVARGTSLRDGSPSASGSRRDHSCSSTVSST